jgi:hypothetical protein
MALKRILFNPKTLLLKTLAVTFKRKVGINGWFILMMSDNRGLRA